MQQLALKLLDDLQLKESRLLSWGMVDGAFSRAEIIEFADERVRDIGSPYDGEELIAYLLEHKLLFELPGAAGRYRTRVAEGVRLIARLRQWFSWRSWQESPEVVADFRFAIVPRRYPDRCISVEEAIETLRSSGVLKSEFASRLASEILGGWQVADFQVEATRAILSALEQSAETGSVISAGTGSGKTIAFYLPAILHLAARKSSKNPPCIALYPRTELLRDQLRTAVGHALRLRETLERSRDKPLSVGPLYGAVPKDWRSLDQPHHGDTWTRVILDEEPGRRCPYLDCPHCGSPLIWKDADRRKGKEILVCSKRECQQPLGGEILRLTRTSLRDQPPDILFTTTEMLNRSLADRELSPIFGVGQKQTAPSLVLLDEVHTYGGSHGAQVALTIRRWANAAWKFPKRDPPHFVGLSATLAEAERFMGDLTGVDQSAISLIEPKHLIHEGSEQTLVIRARPGVATLSTTIQTAMLLRRLLDPRGAADSSDGVFGQRVFAFTDNLDVTNRLFFQLGDAEGWQNPAARRPAARKSLAALRATTEEDPEQRFREGQSWDLVEEIGHPLASDLRYIIGRTSSQDTKVASDADVVVATASLEVGFDDPLVGAVIQHQAPKDPAAFLQRKGRAGRSRGMRPWTVVVLSDYGRDRLTYQAYESLFSPEIPPRHLPLNNRHIRRMQAALCLMDWLAFRVPGAKLWTDLAGPAKTRDSKARQDRLVKELRRLLEDIELRASFSNVLRYSLDLESEEEAETLLWEAPRSLVFEVWPTTLRRLETQWKRIDGRVDGHAATQRRPHPLPEFIPRALFEDLNLPEVQIDLERNLPAGKNADPQYMPIRQALSEFAPGRVTLRYAIDVVTQADWITPPLDQILDHQGDDGFDLSLDIATFCPVEDSQPLGTFQYFENGELCDALTFRPHRICTKVVPPDYDTRSNAQPEWHTQIFVQDEELGSPLPVPSKSNWHDLVADARTFTHEHGNPVEMRRFSTGANLQLKLSGPPQQKLEGRISYEIGTPAGNQRAAIGFVEDVDALAVSLNLPDSPHALVQKSAELTRSSRTMLFTENFNRDSVVQIRLDVFQRRIATEAYLAAVLREAVVNGCCLRDAAESLYSSDRGEGRYREVLPFLRPSGSGARGETDSDAGSDIDPGEVDKSVKELIQTLVADDIADRLRHHAEILWRPLSEADDSDLAESMKATFASCLLQACQRLCPQVQAEDIVIDLGHGHFKDTQQEHQIWLSEAAVGGVGFVEMVRKAWLDDPGRVFSLLDAALNPADSEQTDRDLRLLLLEMNKEDTESERSLGHRVQSVREAISFDEQSRAFEELLANLREQDLALQHATVSAISLRLLRPGSDADSDARLLDLLNRCDQLEQTHGIEIDDRIHAVLLAFDPDSSLRWGTADAEKSRTRVFHTVMGLLWPRGGHARRQALAFWNAYAAPTWSDRLLLRELFPAPSDPLDIDDPEWRSKMERKLIQTGRAELATKSDGKKLLREVALDLAGSRVASETLLMYPRVRGLARRGDQIVLSVELPELS